MNDRIPGSMTASVLLTSPARPYPLLEGRFSPFDQMGFRFTRGQDIFTMQEHAHFYGLHLMAQNIEAPARVLEFPSLNDLERELKAGDFSILGITTNVFNLQVVAEMCRLARRVSPSTTIVVGGNGTRCLHDEADRTLQQGRDYDHLCLGDGIAALRDLLGESTHGPVTGRLPLCGSGLPWLSPRLAGNSGIILSGLGCTTRCPFCSTSAQHGGKYVEIMDGHAIFRAMKQYWRTSQGLNFTCIVDENFLNQPDKFQELGRLIRDDQEFGLGRLNYLAFASADHVSALDPEELLLAGVDGLWIGVESLFTRLAKRRDVDMKALFEQLHAHGISTVGSTIAGFDFHTPESLDQDLDYYTSLSPTLQQIAILSVIPSTSLWHSMRQAGRLMGSGDHQQSHLYGETLQYRHFTHQELARRVDGAYRADA